jgi:hypothetical protein
MTISLLLPTCVIPAGAAEVLITQEEAQLPPPKGAVGVDRRGVTRGPKVELVSAAGEIPSPSRFQLKFLSYGGATIDTSSLKVIYLRTPNVDLTSRVMSFVKPTGLDIPDAVLPPGEHMLRVDIKDSDGRSGSTSFILRVTH